MKPLNNDNNGCSPISSNCVIWQGPDIPCIKLCKGDSVSDTVYKLATELCEILTTLDINTYDLTCLVSTGCAPEDFQGLIQLIISKICLITESGLTPTESSKVIGESIDTIVPVAPCFIFTNEYGDRVTTMSLSLYVRTIGNKICDLVNQINSMNLLLSNHETRITTLENTPPPTFALANLTPTCVLPPSPTDIYSIISATEQQFCDLRASLGLPNDIFQALTAQCVGLSGSSVMGPSGGNMASIPGWFSTVQNLAQSYTNLWLTVCDLRAAVQTIKLNCCPSGCDGVAVNMTTVLTGTNLTIYLTGTIPVGFQDCNPAGSLFTISDTLGASYSVRISVVNQINAVGGTVVSLAATSINPLSDISTDADICVTDGVNTCQLCVDYVARSMSNCPVLTITATTDTSLDYTYNVVYVPGTYTVELWDSAGTMVIASTTTVVAVAGPIAGSFTSLVASTSYKIRVVADIGGNITQCAFATVTTTPVVCDPPTGVTAAFDVPLACPMCGTGLGILGFTSAASADGWYIDDNSPFLKLYTGGSFNNFFESLPDMNTIGDGVTLNTQEFFKDITCINDPTASHAYHGCHIVPDCFSLPGPGIAGSGGFYFYRDTTQILFIPTVLPYFPPRKVVYDPNNGGRLYINRRGSADIDYMDLNTLIITYTAATAANFLIRDMVFNPLNNFKYLHLNAFVQRMDLTDTVTTVHSFVAGTTPNYVAINTNNGDVWTVNGCNAGQSEVNVYDSANVLLDTFIVGAPWVTSSTTNAHRLMTYNPVNNKIYLAVMDDCAAPLNFKIIQFDGATHVESDLIVTGLLVTMYWSTTFNKLITFSNGGNTSVIDAAGNLVATPTPTAGLNFWPADDPVYLHLIGQNAGPLDNVRYMGIDEDNVVACDGEGIVDFHDATNTEGPYYFDTVSESWLPYVTYTSMLDNGDGTVTITAILINNAEATMMYSSNGGLTWTNSGGFITAADWALGQTFTIAQPFLFQLAILTTDACGLSGPTNDTFN